MKTLTLLIFFVMISMYSEAQGLQEWFSQTATQKKYLLQQIAALQVYIEYLKKGYDIAHKGLSTIKNIKQGHFDLDTSFFNSLKIVNPEILKYEKVVEIEKLVQQILTQCKTALVFIKRQEFFTTNDKDYATIILNTIVSNSSMALDNLITVITNGNLGMSDDERISRIDQIYDRVLEYCSAVKSFDNEVKILSAQRAAEIKDVQALRSIYQK